MSDSKSTASPSPNPTWMVWTGRVVSALPVLALLMSGAFKFMKPNEEMVKGLDHIGWKAIDAKRVAVGMKPIAEDRPDKYSTFLSRQPEHVEIAGAMGLGEWNEAKMDVRRIKL